MLVAARKLVARSLVLSPDVQLEYVDDGPASGLPVVFLHGLADSWKSFAGVVAHLPDWMRAIAISLRGHGESSRPASGYSMRAFANDVREALDALEIRSAVVAGHSMGSAVAQRFALDHPDRTTALVLMGSGARMRRNASLRDLSSVIAPMTDPIDRAFVREFQESTVARAVVPGLIDAAVAESLKVPAAVWREALSSMIDTDYADELRTLAAPTLVTWGTSDSIFFHRDQLALRDVIPGARLIVYPGGGHGFHWEDPATFASDLASFCRSL